MNKEITTNGGNRLRATVPGRYAEPARVTHALSQVSATARDFRRLMRARCVPNVISVFFVARQNLKRVVDVAQMRGHLLRTLLEIALCFLQECDEFRLRFLRGGKLLFQQPMLEDIAGYRRKIAPITAPITPGNKLLISMEKECPNVRAHTSQIYAVWLPMTITRRHLDHRECPTLLAAAN